MARDLPTPDPRVGTIIADRYRIDALLGEGGMGKVYAAEHVLMRKRLAVKVLHRELTTVPEVVARFEREAMAAANIDHPNVAAATDFGKLPDGSVFLVLEYVEGRNLRDEIAQGPLGIERAVSIARQIASALASAHTLNIVHRDLKPENVMLVSKATEPDFVKVLDFGIAKVPIGENATFPGKAITKIGMVFGTPEYMSPEQALGQTVDGRADLYALGVIFYEMLAGLRPYSSNNQVGILGQQLSKPIPSLGERAPGISIPPAVEQVVRTLLEREAADRYQTAELVVAALEGLLGLPVAGAPRLFTQLSGSIPAPLAPPSGPQSSQPQLDEPTSANPSVANPQLTSPRLPSFELSGYIDPSSNNSALTSGVEALSRTSLITGDEATRALPGKSLLNEEAARAQPLPTGAKAPSVLEELHRVFQIAVTHTETLHRKLPPQLQRVPALAYLASASILGVTVLVGAIVWGSSLTAAPIPAPRQGVSVLVSGTSGTLAEPSGPSVAPTSSEHAPAEPRTTSPTMDQLDAAKKKGTTGLVALAGQFPKNGRVLLELARLHRIEKHDDKALEVLGKALGVDPSLKDDAEVRELLMATAPNTATLEPSFSLLEKPMGAKGADIIYELLNQKDASAPLKDRCTQYLASDTFSKVASPALLVAAKLSQAKSAKDVAGLLDDAKQNGDQRAVERLKYFEQKYLCEKYKPNRRKPCIHPFPFLDGPTLARVRTTLDEISKRTAPQTDAPH